MTVIFVYLTTVNKNIIDKTLRYLCDFKTSYHNVN